MKILLILLAAFALSCTKKKLKDVNPAPLSVVDTVTLDPQQRNWWYSVDDPFRGRIRVEIFNNTDTVKTFVILVKELGE